MDRKRVQGKDFKKINVAQALYASRRGTFVEVIRNPETMEVLKYVPLYSLEKNDCVELQIHLYSDRNILPEESEAEDV